MAENGNDTVPVDTDMDTTNSAPIGPTHASSGKFLGTVKWFNSAKGFGFVTPNDQSLSDIFVHQSSIHADGFRSLGENEVIEFNVITDEEGKSKAVDVTGPNGDFVQGAPKRESRRKTFNNTNSGNANGNTTTMRPRAPRRPRKPANSDNDTTTNDSGESSGLQVVVHNLSWSTDWRMLKEKFAPCGEVVRADVATDQSGRSRGFGTIRFETVEQANEAIEVFHNSEMDGRVVTVRLDRFA